MITRIGSIIAVLCMIIISIMTYVLLDSWVIIATCITYLLGVQGTTIAFHLPLNNKIQKIKDYKISFKFLQKKDQILKRNRITKTISA